MKPDETVYSKELEGDPGNYRWPVKFDINGAGYLGLSQRQDGIGFDRILLAPAQTRALLKFLAQRVKR